MKTKITILTLIMISFFANISYAQDLATKLKGKILLQVEQNGEAWYVNPKDEQRYYMGRPEDAFNLMRKLGVGITNSNLAKISVGIDKNYLDSSDTDQDSLPDALEDAIGTNKNIIDTDQDGYSDKMELQNNYNPVGEGILNIDSDFTRKQIGKIFLQIENNGEAWYINSSDLKKYFLGRPADAFLIMKNLGLGITDQKLDEIPIASLSDIPLKTSSSTVNKKNSINQKSDLSSLNMNSAILLTSGLEKYTYLDSNSYFFKLQLEVEKNVSFTSNNGEEVSMFLYDSTGKYVIDLRTAIKTGVDLSKEDFGDYVYLSFSSVHGNQFTLDIK